MTSEVALLNRSAVALAADSATTVTYYENGERKERYFKGTNKIFNMSAAHPVALMTFGSADLQGVPWEVVVKAYRDQLGAKSHDHLKAYATDFFEYLQTNLYLYPQDLQEREFLAAVVNAASFILSRAWAHESVKAEPNASRKNELAIQVYYQQLRVIQVAPFIGDLTVDLPVSILARYQDQIAENFRNDGFIKLFESDFDLRDVATVAVFSLFKKGLTTFEQSGIVVAGFGDNDLPPAFRAID